MLFQLPLVTHYLLSQMEKAKRTRNHVTVSQNVTQEPHNLNFFGCLFQKGVSWAEKSGMWYLEIVLKQALGFVVPFQWNAGPEGLLSTLHIF